MSLRKACIALIFLGLLGCSSDNSSHCDHGNRIYQHGVAANDPSCPHG